MTSNDDNLEELDQQEREPADPPKPKRPRRKYQPDSISDDMLRGATAIAEFMLGDPKQRPRVYFMSDPARTSDPWPVFREGGMLVARKSTLLAYLAERERRLL